MRRLKLCAEFGLWFVGLGYIVMWLIAGPLNWPLGLRNICGADDSLSCALVHPQALPPLVHVVGLVAAIVVLVRLLLIALRDAKAPAVADDVARRTRRARKPQPTVERLKARDHFGLRGLER